MPPMLYLVHAIRTCIITRAHSENDRRKGGRDAFFNQRIGSPEMEIG
jgi:hypothetical protein